jgi:hypothetical protein
MITTEMPSEGCEETDLFPYSEVIHLFNPQKVLVGAFILVR